MAADQVGSTASLRAAVHLQDIAQLVMLAVTIRSDVFAVAPASLCTMLQYNAGLSGAEQPG